MSKNQREVVLNYIKDHGSITARQAYHLGIMRLASRISDLKKAGFDIISDTVKVKNRDGSFAYVSRYSIRKEESKCQK